MWGNLWEAMRVYIIKAEEVAYMKRLTVSIFTLFFILTLSGCGKHTQGGRDTVRDSAEVDVPADNFLADTVLEGGEEDNTDTIPDSKEGDFINSTPQAAEFSYAEVLETYHENDPGVKNSGFHNASLVAIETLSDVLRLAKNECTVEYDTADISYDSTACVWQVVFYKSGTVGGDQTVYMDCTGATCLVVYGE